MASPSNPRPPPARKLISFRNDDLLFRTLADLGCCDEFDIEDFIADSAGTTSKARKNLTEFTLFPKLCAELQMKIWAHAYADLESRKVSIIQRTNVPALLQVCFDAREVGLGIYTRQEHAATPSMPAFVSIIDFNKDTVDLTFRGIFANPQVAGSEASKFTYTPVGTTRIWSFDFRNNPLLYATHHYPYFCKHVKRMILRSCYMPGPGERSGDWFPICEFFHEHFPLVESVGTVSSGVRERNLINTQNESPIARLQRLTLKAIERLDDQHINHLLKQLNKKRLLKYTSPGTALVHAWTY